MQRWMCGGDATFFQITLDPYNFLFIVCIEEHDAYFNPEQAYVKHRNRTKFGERQQRSNAVHNAWHMWPAITPSLYS